MIKKGLTDQRSLRVFAADGIKSCVIHDAKSDVSSACLTVRAGAWSNPDSLPGLAHLLEHMVFLGSREFPAEDAYRAFIEKAGGRCNASTSSELTSYYFVVPHASLRGALEIFAAAVRDPLLRSDSVAREVHAVDHENSRNKSSDFRRQWAAQRAHINRAHPAHKFGTGSKETLMNLAGLRALGATIGDDAAAVVDDESRMALLLADQLKQHYSRFYLRDRICVGLCSSLPLDELEGLVRSQFVGFPRAPVDGPPPTSQYPASPVSPVAAPSSDLLGHVLIVPPVAAIRSLAVSWFVPFGLRARFAELPTGLFGMLAGHEGPGSVLASLKRRNLASELSAGAPWQFDDFGFVKVTVSLTALGEQRLHDVVDTLFAYMQLLRDAAATADGRLRLLQAYRESAAEHQLVFDYSSRPRANAAATSAAKNLQFFPDEDVLAAGCIATAPLPQDAVAPPDSALRLIDALTPDNCYFTFSSKSLLSADTDAAGPAPLCPLVERAVRMTDPDYEFPYYFGAYVPRQSANGGGAPPTPADLGLRLPEPNPFFPEHELISLPSVRAELNHPARRAEIAGPGCWLLLDDVFSRPRAYFKMRYQLPAVNASPATVVAIGLLGRVLNDCLAEPLYAAEIAGLHYEFSALSDGMDIKVSGVNEKAPRLADTVLRMLRELPDAAIAEALPRALDRAQRHYESQLTGQSPSALIGELFNCMRHPAHHFVAQRLALFTSDDRPDFAALIGQLLAEIRSQPPNIVLLGGSVTNEQLEAVKQSLVSQFGPGSGAEPSTERPLKVAQFPDHTRLVYRHDHGNLEEENCAASLIFQAGQLDVDEMAALTLFSTIVRPRCFNVLRTQQQLGYIVNAQLMSANDGRGGPRILYFKMVVQGKKSLPEQVERKMDAFLVSLQSFWDDMSVDEFEKHRSGLLDGLLEKDTAFAQGFDRAWGEIVSSTLDFDRIAKLADAVRRLTLADVVSFYQTLIRAPSLAIHVHSKLATEALAGDAAVEPADADAPSTELGADVDSVVPSALYQVRRIISDQSEVLDVCGGKLF